MRNNFSKIAVPVSVIGAIVIALIFLAGTRAYGARSEAFKHLSNYASRSPLVEQKIGKVEAVNFDYFGTYREKFVGSDKEVDMPLKVRGTKGDAKIEIEAERTDGLWKVTSLRVDGVVVNVPADTKGSNP